MLTEDSSHVWRTIMAKLPIGPASPDPQSKRPAMARYAIRLILFSVASFAIAFALRRAFFWDIKPVFLGLHAAAERRPGGGISSALDRKHRSHRIPDRNRPRGRDMVESSSLALR
jgi:hypothetical protein